MPEGPEVQSIVTDLKSLIVGRRILDLVTNDYTRRLFGDRDVDQLREQISGLKILDVVRRGKNIVVHMAGDIYLVLHLRMTGQVFLRDDVPKFCRLTIKLDGDGDLHLADVRTFATCEVCMEDEMRTFSERKRIGVDALSTAFNVSDLKPILQSKRRLPAVLLDQTKISGLGNIYVNEALFVAGIHPLREAESLSISEIERLHKAIKTVLTKAIKNRGTTFSDYRLPGGEIGNFQNHLKVFRRAGDKCKKCGAIIQRAKLGGRSVFYCYNCQI